MSARARRRILIVCVVITAVGTALNLAAMVAGHSNRFTVILFCVEFSGLFSSIASLRSMRGPR